jgi:hypothetical protein
MERIKILTHNKSNIAFLDAKNLSEDENCEWIDKLNNFAITNKIRLLLLDVTGTHITVKVKEAASASAKKTNAILGKTYIALIGLTPMQRMLANVINQGQYFASDMEDGKRWLASRPMS